jgi:heme oxygenase
MQSLTERLSAATKELHHEAHQAADWLIKGEFTLKDYKNYIEQLLHVYGGLEYQLERRSMHPVVSIIAAPDLCRTASLEKDVNLSYILLKRDGYDIERPPICKEEFTTTMLLNNIYEPDIPQLAAHAWVRYVGDLSGGVMIGKLLKKALPKAPYSFYEYDYSTDTLKADYKAAFDTIPEEYHDEIVEGVKTAFKLNIELLEACDPR